VDGHSQPHNVNYSLKYAESCIEGNAGIQIDAQSTGCPPLADVCMLESRRGGELYGGDLGEGTSIQEWLSVGKLKWNI
jgi:hypothetical protein